MYSLHYSPGSASMVVHLALLEIGAPYELVKVDLEAGAQRDPKYLAINPLGRVPTLIVDGEPHFESAALLLLLAERHPDAGLAPPVGDGLRGDWYQWTVFFANAFMPTYRLWFYPPDLGSDEHAPEVRDALRSRIETLWALVEMQLAKRGPYMLGERFSAVDLLATMLMRWSRDMPRPAITLPNLRKLADLVRARPSWQRLYEIEGLTEWRA
jgi:glutathione S-transferase